MASGRGRRMGSGQGERETGDEAGGGRLERGRGQGTAEIRLVYTGDRETRGHGVVAQPAEGELIDGREQDQGVRGAVPARGDVRVGNGEIKGRVRRLTRLISRWQITTGYQVQARWDTALAMRHMRDNSTFPRRPDSRAARDAGTQRLVRGTVIVGTGCRRRDRRPVWCSRAGRPKWPAGRCPGVTTRTCPWSTCWRGCTWRPGGWVARSGSATRPVRCWP